MNESNPVNAGAQSRILVLEPDKKEADRLVAAIGGNEAGFDLVLRHDPDKTLADIAAGKAVYDAAVVTNSIPGDSGVGFSHRLKRHLQPVSTLVLFEPGEEDEASAALLAGADDILVRDTDGGYLRLLPARLRKILDADPGTSGASVFARDITEKKTYENQLKESEQRFRRLAEAINDVFYILDIEKRQALYVSPAYEDLYGRSVNEVYENPVSWMEVVHPDDRERVLESFSTLGETVVEGFQGSEYRIVKPDGSIRWLHHRAFVFKTENGRPTQIVGVATDVTASKEARKRIQESEEKYRTLVDHASDGILVSDMEGGYIEANDSACAMLGYSRDELFRLNFRDIVTKEDLERNPPQIDDLKGGELIVKERQLRRKDGSIFTVEGSFKALPNDRFQIIIRDITERKKAEAILLRSQEELEQRVAERTRELRVTIEAYEKAQRLASIGTLAAGIAHEINNPIGSILMAADAALYSLDDSKKKGDVVEALASIKDDAKRAGQIVKTVLQLSREEDSQKWPRDAGDVARRARDISRREAVQNNVHVELEIESNLPKVMINPTEIEQVFVNLITNAIEASGYGQTIWVRLTADGEAKSVLSRFVDEGRGMPGEEIDRIFDPFYTTRQDEGGTGLGLSLTHSIVRQHGGTIEVDSRPRKGTTITVTLPVAGN